MVEENMGYTCDVCGEIFLLYFDAVACEKIHANVKKYYNRAFYGKNDDIYIAKLISNSSVLAYRFRYDGSMTEEDISTTDLDGYRDATKQELEARFALAKEKVKDDLAKQQEFKLKRLDRMKDWVV